MHGCLAVKGNVIESAKQAGELGEFMGNVIAGIHEGVHEGAANNESHFAIAADRDHQSRPDYFAWQINSIPSSFYEEIATFANKV